eukprot:4183510-Amphidinium_carterae.2
MALPSGNWADPRANPAILFLLEPSGPLFHLNDEFWLTRLPCSSVRTLWNFRTPSTALNCRSDQARGGDKLRWAYCKRTEVSSFVPAKTCSARK